MDERPSRDQLFLTTEEVAARLRVKQRTVQELIERQELGAIRVGRDYRVPAPAVEAYLRGHATANDAHVPLSEAVPDVLGAYERDPERQEVARADQEEQLKGKAF